MDFDVPWLQLALLVIPVAFALGWIAARLDLRQLTREQLAQEDDLLVR